MEPVAYFVSLGTAVAAYMYFLITKESFDYKPLRQVRRRPQHCARHTIFKSRACDDVSCQGRGPFRLGILTKALHTLAEDLHISYSNVSTSDGAELAGPGTST